jgi:hypothetical protein
MICENIFLTQDVSKLAPESLEYLGLLITANKPIDGMPLFIQDGGWWMLDNGAFSKVGFKEHYWLDWLEWMSGFDIQDKCICVVVPDVVGDAKKTLELFIEYNDTPKKMGYRTGLATQWGMKKEQLPWDDFDILFIGGPDDHKMGLDAAYLIEEGLKRDKHIHVGRVNTAFRLMKFWHCHTWDGTALTIKPEKYESIIIKGVLDVIKKKNDMRQLPMLFPL